MSSIPQEFLTSACTLPVGNSPGFPLDVACAPHTPFEEKADCEEEGLISGCMPARRHLQVPSEPADVQM